MSQRLYSGRYKALLHTSYKPSTTLSVTTLASNTEKSDKVGDREIIFYDKVRELHRHGVKTVYLMNSLSEKEKMLLHKWNYCDERQELSLRHLNIMRVELQYGSSNKLANLSKFLGFEDSQKGLFFEDFFGLLLNGNLYEKLNEFYTKMLTETLLLGEDSADSKLNVYQRIIQNNWNIARDLPIYSVLKNNGLACEYRKNMQKFKVLLRILYLKSFQPRLEEIMPIW